MVVTYRSFNLLTDLMIITKSLLSFRNDLAQINYDTNWEHRGFVVARDTVRKLLLDLVGELNRYYLFGRFHSSSQSIVFYACRSQRKLAWVRQFDAFNSRPFKVFSIILLNNYELRRLIIGRYWNKKFKCAVQFSNKKLFLQVSRPHR